MTEPLVDSLTLEANRDVFVAQVALVLTLYVHDMEAWEHGGAAAACREFLDVCPPKNLRWFTTSRLSVWNRVGPDTVEALVSNLTWAQKEPRHGFGFWLSDEPGGGSCLFAYRAFDTERAGRAGVVQLALPQDTDPGLLWQLALSIGHQLPITCGIGGYGASWNSLYSHTAFHEMRAWCRRYLGLDVQEPERMSWQVEQTVAGTNWLTLIGPRLLSAWKEDASRYVDHPWQSEHVMALPLSPGGVLIRAGEQPTLADLNRFVYPEAYVEVARRLAERLPEEPTPFTGGFFVHEDTSAWMRRFLEPEAWR